MTSADHAEKADTLLFRSEQQEHPEAAKLLVLQALTHAVLSLKHLNATVRR